jgi:TonB family protein
MKTTCFRAFIILLLFPAVAAAQNITPAEPVSSKSLVKDFLCESVVYPEDALSAGREGVVRLKFLVDEQGNVSNIRVVGSVNPELDAEAIRLFRMIEWKPAMKYGSPILSEQEFEIDFSIKKYNKHCKERGYGQPEYLYTPVDSSNYIYLESEVDEPPYPVFDEKGMTLSKFMSSQLQYPADAFRESLSGNVILLFVVEPFGRISNVVVQKAVGGGCTEEAIRLL